MEIFITLKANYHSFMRLLQFLFSIFPQKQILLLTTVFAVICATKEQSTNSGYAQPGEHTIHNQHTIYGQSMQDNIATETELAKRASASLSTTSGSSNPESQGQTSQIDVG